MRMISRQEAESFVKAYESGQSKVHPFDAAIRAMYSESPSGNELKDPKDDAKPFDLNEVQSLADEYRANHPNHETPLPNGAELGGIADEMVALMRLKASGVGYGWLNFNHTAKCYKAAEKARELATNERRLHGYNDKAVAAMQRNYQ